MPCGGGGGGGMHGGLYECGVLLWRMHTDNCAIATQQTRQWTRIRWDRHNECEAQSIKPKKLPYQNSRYTICVFKNWFDALFVWSHAHPKPRQTARSIQPIYYSTNSKCTQICSSSRAHSQSVQIQTPWPVKLNAPDVAYEHGCTQNHCTYTHTHDHIGRARPGVCRLGSWRRRAAIACATDQADRRLRLSLTTKTTTTSMMISRCTLHIRNHVEWYAYIQLNLNSARCRAMALHPSLYLSFALVICLFHLTPSRLHCASAFFFFFLNSWPPKPSHHYNRQHATIHWRRRRRQQHQQQQQQHEQQPKPRSKNRITMLS